MAQDARKRGKGKGANWHRPLDWFYPFSAMTGRCKSNGIELRHPTGRWRQLGPISASKAPTSGGRGTTSMKGDEARTERTMVGHISTSREHSPQILASWSSSIDSQWLPHRFPSWAISLELRNFLGPNTVLRVFTTTSIVQLDKGMLGWEEVRTMVG